MKANLVKKKTKNNGIGIFANKSFKKGEVLIEFKGKTMKRIEIPALILPEDDRYIQIGVDKYLGPSGEFDDFINHSCNPNSGIKLGSKAILIAIREIKSGEEITWDYSTTMDEDDWEMDCHCGTSICRKRIRDFKYLPKEVQNKYISLAVVPQYILDNI